MYDVTVVDFSKKGTKILITANNGSFDDELSSWKFNKGKIMATEDEGCLLYTSPSPRDS